MNRDFTFYNPTKIHFGREALGQLESELRHFGNNVLLIYGRNAIKANGLYDKIITILKLSHKNIFELSGVMSNPTYDKVLEGAAIAREHNIDLILAVGGGSVIDCAKAVSVATNTEGDAFERFWQNYEPVQHEVIPIATILTMVGTGSEMNTGSVITNDQLKIKAGRIFDNRLAPKFSILNPEYTFTVPYYQMVSGIYDIMSHLMEQYFGGEDDCTSDYLNEGLMRAIINNARIAIKDQENYEARSNIMWASTVALNGLIGLSKRMDWNVHAIEHQLGAYTDCAHGMGLAAISIPYYRYIYRHGLPKFVRYAINVWGIDPANKSDEAIALAGIQALADFINECGIVNNIRDLGATEEMLPLIAESTSRAGGYMKLTSADVLHILKEAM